MKFKAAILAEINRPLVIDEISINKLLYGQVLVKIDQSGVCRSQIFEVDGERGHDKWLPHLLGHEALGEVVDIGDGVETVKIGDYVILSWIKSKGISANPAKYNWNDRVVNSGRITTFSEYSICSEDRCVKISKSLVNKVGASIGCAIPTGYGLSLTLKELKVAKNVGIIGLGGIGMSALLGILNETSARVLAVDINEERLEQAKQLGTHFTINAKKNSNLKVEIEKIFPNLLDVVIECTGLVGALENSLSLINTSGIVKFVSHPKHGDLLKIDPFELILGKRIEGSWGGDIDPDKHLDYMLRKIYKNNDFISMYSTKNYSLDEINEAIYDLKMNKILRPVIKM